MTDAPGPAHGFDAGTYGRSFADVYDIWYPMDADTAAAVGYLDDLSGPARRIIEVGVGTGRLAIPLAQLGHAVSGMDSSTEMLSVLGDKALEAGVTIQTSLGDACVDDSWPTGPFDLVVAAYNFVFNLIGDVSKHRFLRHAANALGADGRLVVESHLPVDHADTYRDGQGDPDTITGTDPVERRLELKEIAFDTVVLIASETDHANGIVMGQHIEIRDGEPLRLRPWKVHVVTPQHLDDLAAEVGLQLVERHGGWDGSPFGSDSYTAVSVYRRVD